MREASGAGAQQAMPILRLTADAAAEYRACMLEGYAADPVAFTATVAERSALPLAWWAARLASGALATDVVLAAMVGQRLAGVVGVSFAQRDKTRHKATLFGLYVRSEFGRRGVGRALVMAALELARQRAGIKIVQLTVTEQNGAARALYARCGFVPFGLEPLAVVVGDQFMAKVHMWHDLGLPLPE